MIRRRSLLAFIMLAAVLVFAAGDADARAGGGFSGGSRGMRTFSAPPATRTAPNAASPLERSMTQPGQRSSALFGSASRPGFFGGGLLGGLAAGFLGAGLFGLLFGHGLFGGMSGFGSVLGLLLQIGLIFIVARLVIGWWQRRNMPAFAGGAPAHNFDSSASAAGFGANAPAGAPLTIGKSDYDAFERLLAEVQNAYGAEDLVKLRELATPEMVSYFADELAKNASRGVVNEISLPTLLQGDLAESWREDETDYATVAMRFSLIDRTIERATGRVVEGDASRPTEATEVWTFMRAQGGDWLLSAIQQA